MAADPRDDFSAFAGAEHMLFQLRDPYRMIREEVEAALRGQVSDTEVTAIACGEHPKFLTLGRKTDDGTRVIVSHFGFCVRAQIALTYDAGARREELAAALTFLFGRIDEPGRETQRVFLDVHGDAEQAYTDEGFQARFVAFRSET
ncbi:MAG TPA: hypothetical protein VLM79_37360 [Kofleriaceae bacterium]|nr:hypothetical protein [Kofleriaceae bacterium]